MTETRPGRWSWPKGVAFIAVCIVLGVIMGVVSGVIADALA